jgi:hypothetical protein
VLHDRLLSPFVALLLLAAPVSATPQDQPAASRLLAARAATPPVVDGVLDDAAWSREPLTLGDWLSYNPLYGDRIAQQTSVWVAYDDRFLYFAFRCSDPEPARIRTGVRRRDDLFNDDWVGLSLDSLGTRQTSYDMFVNPSGMQADILTNNASGENVAPDWVWESAGRVTATGYEVELRVPLESIRFRGGDEVHMGVVFWRRISRLGVSVSWPDLPPGKSAFERCATLVLQGLRERAPREVIPSYTHSLDQHRQTPTAFAPAETTPNVGVTAKYGISSSVTVEGTVNPDFSQVESDAFQVEVNQRYPNFYTEKRPFFMEGSGIFSLAGPGGDCNLITAVHTRRIVDPIGGLKTTGTIGKITFGVLSAADQAPGQASQTDTPNPYEGKDKFFNVARAQYSLGASTYVGAILTDARFAGGFNRVVGADASVKIDDHQRVSAMALYSNSLAPAGTPGGGNAGQGGAAHVSYSYDSRTTNIGAFAEHYDERFQMDTAFYNQTGITRGWVFADRNLYPDKKRYPWIRRISPFVFVQGGRDRIARGNDLLIIPGIRMNFSRQGFFRVDRFFGQEPWLGHTFSLDRWRIMGNGQMFRWLNVDGRVTFGDATYYDRVDPFQGRFQQEQIGINLQPTPRFSESVSYTFTRFDRVSGEKVYDLDIVNTRTTFQFTKHFFLRGIVQFDSLRRQILTDALASYELRPGTVVHAGYGSLVEQRAFEGGNWIPAEGAYQTTRRSLFFKASYLFRF